jgi:TrmH family RNA methyltransferase
MITSAHNPKIQWVRNLQARSRLRREAQAFVVEGVRLAGEALASGWAAQLMLYTADSGERARTIVEGFAQRGTPAEQVTPQVLKAASDTLTQQGILVVLSMQPLPVPAQLDFAFIPDGVRDPGNLGTMLRTAAAAGVGAVFLPPGSVDAYSPKVLRAGMGAHFRLPVLNLDWEGIAAQMRLHGLTGYLATAGQGVDYARVDLCSPLAILVGGEAAGPGQDAQNLSKAYLHIPMPGGMESLNTAMAAGILLFEVVRQRRSQMTP